MHCLSEAFLLDRFRERGCRERSANGLDHGVTLEAPLRPIHRVGTKGPSDTREGVYVNRLDLLRNQPTAHDNNRAIRQVHKIPDCPYPKVHATGLFRIEDFLQGRAELRVIYF
jgi:hypothetical protein